MNIFTWYIASFGSLTPIMIFSLIKRTSFDMATTPLRTGLLIEYFLRSGSFMYCLLFAVLSCLFWVCSSCILKNACSSLHKEFYALICYQVPRKFTSKVEGKMGYEDFVYFILSEEDKSSEPSLEYWSVSELTVNFLAIFALLMWLKSLVSAEWRLCYWGNFLVKKQFVITTLSNKY